MIAAVVITSSFPATTVTTSGQTDTATDARLSAAAPTILIVAEPTRTTLHISPDRVSRATRTAVTAAQTAATAQAKTTQVVKKRPVKTTPVKQRPPAKPKKTTVAATTTVRSDGSRVSVVVGFALAQVGKPYRWGSAGPGAYDCSGLTMAAFARAGIRLPHQSGGQASAGRAVTRAQLQRGDLILYSGHVAIALGGGMMVHAANPRTGIVVAKIYGSPIGYRRLL